MRVLGFTKEWINSGILNAETLERFLKEYSEGLDRDTEHYRWRAFESFMRGKPSIDETTARSLYQLGENDLDVLMGGSMMATVLKHPDCPFELLKKAADSDREFLKKIATEQLLKRAPK